MIFSYPFSVSLLCKRKTWFLLMWVVMWPAFIQAEGFRGFLEFGYTNTDSHNIDILAEEEARNQTSAYLQRYNLYWERALYPNLTINAGGLFQRADASQDNEIISPDPGEASHLQADSTNTKLSPFAGFSLHNPLWVAGGNYRRRADTAKVDGSGSFTNINENYNTTFSYVPEGFPNFNFLYSHNNSFDEDRLFRDNSSDLFLWGLRYAPVKQVNLNYQGNYAETNNHLTQASVETWTHSGLVSYSERFLDNRISLTMSNNALYQETTFLSPGGDGAEAETFANQGLFLASDNFFLVTLDNNNLVNDRNVSIAVSPDANIGTQPSFSNDVRWRNMGLFFNAAASTTEPIGKLQIFVNKALPQDIAALFELPGPNRLRIYVSKDNFTWSEVAVSNIVFFDSVPSTSGGLDLENYFELTLTSVRIDVTPYIKVVASPLASTTPPSALDPSFDLNELRNIFLTELRAFRLIAPGPGRENTSRTLNDTVDITSRVQLLSDPWLFYEFSSFLNYSETDSTEHTNYQVSNGLSAHHQFSPILRGSARIAREDAKSGGEKEVSYQGTTSLNLVPLPTLSHTLVLTGRTEEGGDQPSQSYSAFLNNFAEIYQGIDASVSGGYSHSRIKDTGEVSDSVILNGGASFIPHRSITLNLSHSYSSSSTSGGGKPTRDNFTRRSEVSLTYRPFEALYLFASLGLNDQNDREREVTQSYGGNWSPFRNGSLLFSLFYSESLRSEGNEKTRTIVPSAQWKIRSGWFLNSSYLYTDTTRDTDENELKSFSTNLRMSF